MNTFTQSSFINSIFSPYIRLTTLPETAAVIDWSYYRGAVARAGMVDEFEKKVSSILWEHCERIQTGIGSEAHFWHDIATFTWMSVGIFLSWQAVALRIFKNNGITFLSPSPQ